MLEPMWEQKQLSLAFSTVSEPNGSAIEQRVHTFLEDGDKVAAFGTYAGTYEATGKSTCAEFAHLSPSAVTLPNKWSGLAWV